MTHKIEKKFISKNDPNFIDKQEGEDLQNRLEPPIIILQSIPPCYSAVQQQCNKESEKTLKHDKEKRKERNLKEPVEKLKKRGSTNEGKHLTYLSKNKGEVHNQTTQTKPYSKEDEINNVRQSKKNRNKSFERGETSSKINRFREARETSVESSRRKSRVETINTSLNDKERKKESRNSVRSQIKCWNRIYSPDNCIESEECKKCCCCIEAQRLKNKLSSIQNSIIQRDVEGEIEDNNDNDEGEENDSSMDNGQTKDLDDLTSDNSSEEKVESIYKSVETKDSSNLSKLTTNPPADFMTPSASKKAVHTKKVSNGRKPSRLFPKDYIQPLSSPPKNPIKHNIQDALPKSNISSALEKFSKAVTKANAVTLLSGHRLEYVPKFDK
ncbi:DgyrCDS5185 [Dimorphilus gyrociliatus]|uniref:DgyrCDS5185 n=1 Tax=Dimorphilus gyrociliatus TaxID=2664684 RepID=A0A7I8VKQ3_9ANNE|nr:DgyrCDS5185 [Dimorphilus gyrociliatus]